MKTVLITGGTGLIGNALSKELLAKGYNVIILTRYPEKQVTDHKQLRFAKWDINHGMIDKEAIGNADCIIHLAGASIAKKRWNAKRKKEIIDSRIKSSKLIFNTLNENSNKVKTVICASAIGWYGEPNKEHEKLERQTDDALIETDPPANSFLGKTCKAWEDENQKLTQLGKRLVIFRIGILLSTQGGFLEEIKKTLRFGIAAIIGNGNQIISWIHQHDLVRMVLFAIENEKISGVYNAVANEPVSFKKLVLEYATQFKGRFYISIHVPSFILRIFLGEMSSEILKSIKLNNAKIKKEGFTFLYPHISNAVRGLVKGKGKGIN